MRPRILVSLFALAGLLMVLDAAAIELEGVRLVYMEADKAAGTAKLPAYRPITDPERLAQLDRWAYNGSARTAMYLYRRALEIAGRSSEAPVFHIAVIPNGNHPAVGYRLQQGQAWEERPQGVYIKLDPSERVFNATLLHETGHIVLGILNGGNGIPARDLASIPHTTTALTDRGTAFNEGFAIHLETLAAHDTNDIVLKGIYHHPAFLAGTGAKRQAEYFRATTDLMGYAQSRTRYHGVRENHFAFAPAYKGPDYLRWQLDPARDFTTLRDANQLLQSEGFYASFFFSLLMQGAVPPSPEALRKRQDQMLQVLADVFKARKMDGDTPYLPAFVEAWMTRYPQEAAPVAELFLDLSHGVFMDRTAAQLWAAHYDGVLRMDMAERENPRIESARKAWLATMLRDPSSMYASLAPQVPVAVESRKVLLVAFEEAAPLTFDINTVDPNIIAALPHITSTEAAAWTRQRAQRPFQSPEDFHQRVKLNTKTTKSLSWPH